MENALAKYMGQDIKNIIGKIEIVQGTARDSGNIYYAVELSFINGYTKRLFLRSDEQFAWINAIETLTAQKQIDNVF